MAEAYFYTTKDLVEVVRCKDCKNLMLCGGNTKESSYNWCSHFQTYIKPDDFCSYGEAEEAEEQKMEREILFRGKEAANGKWVYGFYSKHDGITYIEDEKRKHSVYGHTVGQYTGWNDKNGIMVFVGDILSYKDEQGQDKYVIEFFDGRFKIVDDDDLISKAYMDDVRVIGNIHDNPELLKKT